MTIEKARETTARWWAFQIIHAGANWNNGDGSHIGGLAFAMSNTLAMDARKDVSDEQEATFIAELIKQIETEPRAQHHISVDYHPDKPLADALDKAGIPHRACPCKTITWIVEKDGDFKVEARLGYGADMQEITEETLAALT